MEALLKNSLRVRVMLIFANSISRPTKLSTQGKFSFFSLNEVHVYYITSVTLESGWRRQVSWIYITDLVVGSFPNPIKKSKGELHKKQ